MSTHYHLYCEKTGECVEAVAHVGNTSVPRIEANALGAFLLYHQVVADNAPFVLIQLDALEDDRSIMSSLQEVADEQESIGSYAGYKRPVLKWTKDNYLSLAGRNSRVLEGINDFERGPSGGTWVRKTNEGRII